MSTSIILFSSIAYLLFLFFIAFYADKKTREGNSLVNSPYIYALSLAVYCTAWTYYGSVGKAASSGSLGFLTIYIGPILIAPLWIYLLRKIILISKHQRITSIADFISSRYGKSARMGVVVTLIAVIGVIPYIALQLKAIDASSSILSNEADWMSEILDGSLFFKDKAFLLALILTIFTILFGTRHLDPNERHEGLIAAIAFESLWKLVAFLAVGLFVTYGIYDGFSDLFSQATKQPELANRFSMEAAGVDNWSWTWMVLLSMSAIMLLPRQFHVMVVENTNVQHVEKAAWLFPLYLLLINIFVLPIACGGLLHFPEGQVEPDSFVLGLPLQYGQNLLALFVYLGGLSAATGMVVVAVIALSIMISNNLVLPVLVQSSFIQEPTTSHLGRRLLNIRRISIVIVMLIAYTYFKWVGGAFSLISIGLISFAAIAQFLPPVIGGLYWRGATEKGALAGLLVGISVWGLTLGLPTMAEVGLLSNSSIEEGYFGISLLRPYALFGLEGSDHIAHSAFWSLLLNSITYVAVSLNTLPKPIELSQADLFIEIEKYTTGEAEVEVIKRRARLDDLKLLLDRFLGKRGRKRVLKNFARRRQINLKATKTVDAEFINFTETHLAGAIGAASAKVVLDSVVKEDPISLEEMLIIMDQTKEIIQYSKALEKKSLQLEATTHQLQTANEQLKELDRLKADFITTVTHELRTPITSIKALSKIMFDHPNIDLEKREQYLNIIIDESERVARLINQVLDLEKIQSQRTQFPLQPLDLTALVKRVGVGMEEVFRQKNIAFSMDLPAIEISVKGNNDRLTQVVLNLLSNALKFCDSQKGKIKVVLEKEDTDFVVLQVQDNGAGIKQENQKIIFEKFTQLSSQKAGKPTGSGLGLFICKEIIERHGGSIRVSSGPKTGTTFIVKLPLHS
ncbi:MAG: sensor histidine kinase [Bacteroidota bacterium]